MVRIVNYQKRTTEQGKDFFVLELQGGIEMVKSQESGKFYITARKASISSTFDEAVCQALLGSELPGDIVKTQCEPYDYTIRDTGEVIKLSHRFEYSEVAASSPPVQKSRSTIEDFINDSASENRFSTNGQLAH